MDNGSNPNSAKTRIVILGGDFGGVYAARRLGRLLARKPDVGVCLVSRDNFFLFTPMLHKIAAGDLEIKQCFSNLDGTFLRQGHHIYSDRARLGVITNVELEREMLKI